VIDLLAPLDPNRTRLVSCIGRPFLQYHRLPVWGHIESELDREQLDAREVFATLPEIANTRAGMRYGLVWYDRNSLAPNTPLCLTMAGMDHLGNNTRESIGIRLSRHPELHLIHADHGWLGSTNQPTHK
jgi:hypothetical protein